jgi:hypothetical protein
MTGFPLSARHHSTLDKGNGNVSNRTACSAKVSDPTIDRWFDPSCFVAPQLVLRCGTHRIIKNEFEN